jgi:hypothetical protein
LESSCASLVGLNLSPALRAGTSSRLRRRFCDISTLGRDMSTRDILALRRLR